MHCLIIYDLCTCRRLEMVGLFSKCVFTSVRTHQILELRLQYHIYKDIPCKLHGEIWYVYASGYKSWFLYEIAP